jgi:hypothetical protein
VQHVVHISFSRRHWSPVVLQRLLSRQLLLHRRFGEDVVPKGTVFTQLLLLEQQSGFAVCSGVWDSPLDYEIGHMASTCYWGKLLWYVYVHEAAHFSVITCTYGCCRCNVLFLSSVLLVHVSSGTLVYTL